MDAALLTAWRELQDSFDGLKYQMGQKDVDHSAALLHAKATWADATWFIERLKHGDTKEPAPST